jgi:transcription antitermination factor NusG
MENWYAVYTNPGSEVKVAETLSKKNIENYCPLKTSSSTKNWWAFKKEPSPLFASKIFVKLTAERLSEVRQCKGVINILYWLGEPAVIKETEINSIKSFVATYSNVTVEQTMLSYRNVAKGNVIAMESYIKPVLRNNTWKIELASLGLRLCAVASDITTPVLQHKETYIPQLNYEHKYAI